VALMVDVAEGQLDVANIAAKLKERAQPCPTPHEWMDSEDDLWLTPRDTGKR
jgi:hypothetical protein